MVPLIFAALRPRTTLKQLDPLRDRDEMDALTWMGECSGSDSHDGWQPVRKRQHRRERAKGPRRLH